MASRHHHHHHDQTCLHHQNHHNNIPLFATSPHCYTQSNHPSPPPEANLLHLVASYLQNQLQETHCSCETQFHSFNGVRRQHKNVSKPREYDNVVLSCLLRKIDDLESSLNKFSAFYDQRRDRHSSLRDSAARVIQTHFRSYLVHRSISFRQLKELAMIKSSFLSLKSTVSGKPHFPFKAVSRKATDLLLQLDSIQGRIDPMIRSSKRSLSRDLVRFLQYIDDCAIKRSDFVGKSAINVLNGKKPQGLGVAVERPFDQLRKLMEKVVVTSSGDEDNNADMTDDCEEVSMNVIDKRKIGNTKSRTGGFVKGNLVKPPVRKSVVFDKNRNTHDLTSSAEDDDSVESDEEALMISRDNGRRCNSKARKEVLVKGSGGKTNRVVKTVSFDENGNVYKVYGDTPESSITEEDGSTSGSNDGNGNGIGNEVEEIKYVPKENKGLEEEEETHSEDGVSSSEGSEEFVRVTQNANHSESKEHKKEIQLQEGSLMFSPPLPLKMEP